MNKLSEELYNKYFADKLFSEKLSKAQEKDKKYLDQQVTAQKKLVDDINTNIIYKNAFEWRFEFPEVLNNNGEFVGFDVVIGNPPYIRQEEVKILSGYFESNYIAYSGKSDIFVFFYQYSVKKSCS